MAGDAFPSWATGAAKDVLQEFYQRIHESLVILTMSRRGLDHVWNEFKMLPRDPAKPDPYVTVSPYKLGARDVLAPARVRYSKFFELLAEDGQASVELSQQWIVLTFAQWENNYRPRIAEAAGMDPTDIKVDALGDLRHMRNDIAHHLGIATNENSGRCAVLRWFTVGDVVHMSPNHVPELVQALPGYELVPWGPKTT